MSTPHNRQPQWPWTAAILAVSAHFALIYNWANRPFLKLQDYAAGHAALPYQARILMAGILHATAHRDIVTKVAAHAPAQLRDPYVCVQTVCVFIAMAAATLATRASVAALTGDRTIARAACFLLPLMAYFNLMLNYGLNYALPYDVPSLAFFCIGILLIIRRRWLLFYPVFVLALLNRETAIFLTLILAAWSWAETAGAAAAQRIRRIAPHVVVQVALFVAIKLWLHHHFAGNPAEHHGNGLFANSLRTNIHSLLNPGQWPRFASLFAFLPVPLWLGRHSIRHRGLALATAVTVPLWVCLMFVVGVIVEARIFNELASLLALVAALEMYHLWFQHRTAEAA